MVCRVCVACVAGVFRKIAEEEEEPYLEDDVMYVCPLIDIVIDSDTTVTDTCITWINECPPNTTILRLLGQQFHPRSSTYLVLVKIVLRGFLWPTSLLAGVHLRNS